MRESIAEHDTRTFGRIRVIAFEHVTICVGDGQAYHKVLLVSFGRDGSIYVQFPYFRARWGIVAALDFSDTGSIGRMWDLGAIGRATSHLTKFAHHVDGEVHFSQDGRVRTEVRRRSFRLDGPIGHLFQCTAYGLDAFARYTARDERKRRPVVFFTFDEGLPAGVSIVADWHRLETLNRRVHPSATEVGPMAHIARIDGSKGHDYALIAQPTEWTARKHTIVLACESSSRPAGYKEPIVTFVGGWDPHEVSGPSDRVRHTGALLAQYPGGDVDDAALGMPTIDLTPTIFGATG